VWERLYSSNTNLLGWSRYGCIWMGEKPTRLVGSEDDSCFIETNQADPKQFANIAGVSTGNGSITVLVSGHVLTLPEPYVRSMAPGIPLPAARLRLILTGIILSGFMGLRQAHLLHPPCTLMESQSVIRFMVIRMALPAFQQPET
jgi:hypothetical protein